MAMLVCGIAFAEELKYAAVYDIPYKKNGKRICV